MHLHTTYLHYFHVCIYINIYAYIHIQLIYIISTSISISISRTPCSVVWEGVLTQHTASLRVCASLFAFALNLHTHN